MQDIASMKTAMSSLSMNAVNLTHLPTIAQGITALKDGLVSQNASLMSQNAQLIAPGSRAQNTITYLAIAMMLLLGMSVFIVLVRETRKDFRVDRDGISATEHRVEHTETTREVTPSDKTRQREVFEDAQPR